MDFQIRITEDALTDFEGILTYSWDNFPATAERFGNAILNHVEGCSSALAHPHPDLLSRQRIPQLRRGSSFLARLPPRPFLNIGLPAATKPTGAAKATPSYTLCGNPRIIADFPTIPESLVLAEAQRRAPVDRAL